MSVRVVLIDGPLRPAHSSDAERGPACAVGASTTFEGLVRGQEESRTIVALDYEAYEPMATRQLERLASEMADKHGLVAITVEHSVGRVPVGACSFRLVIDSPHRAAGLAATSEFIDRMKRDVPIWKRAVH